MTNKELQKHLSKTISVMETFVLMVARRDPSFSPQDISALMLPLKDLEEKLK